MVWDCTLYIKGRKNRTDHEKCKKKDKSGSEKDPACGDRSDPGSECVFCKCIRDWRQSSANALWLWDRQCAFWQYGALLLVKEEKQIEPGQIVVYQSGQELIVHRVIQIEGNLVTTKGDANEAADPVFDASQIKGVVVGWIPFLGSLVSFLKTPVGIILLLICAVLLMEGSFRKQKVSDDRQLEGIKEEIRRLKEEMNQEEPKKDMQQDEAKKVMQQNESKKSYSRKNPKRICCRTKS